MSSTNILLNEEQRELAELAAQIVKTELASAKRKFESL